MTGADEKILSRTRATLSGSLRWEVRAIVVALAFLVTGLVLPVPPGNAVTGIITWPTPDIDFQKDGDWSDVAEEWEDSLGLADNEWRNNTDWNPTLVGSSQDNDIYWGGTT